MAAMTRMGFWHTGQPCGSTFQTRGIKWRAAEWAGGAGRVAASTRRVLPQMRFTLSSREPLTGPNKRPAKT